MGARPWVARTELDLARLRVATDNAPSPDAIALATSARDTAADLGMATLKLVGRGLSLKPRRQVRSVSSTYVNPGCASRLAELSAA